MNTATMNTATMIALATVEPTPAQRASAAFADYLARIVVRNLRDELSPKQRRRLRQIIHTATR